MSRQKLENVFPLTPLQEGILYHALAAPDSDVYVEQLSCELLGPLDDGALVRAWRLAVERHSVLRTAFVWRNLPRPLQAVHRAAEPPLAREDWQDVPAKDVEACLDRWLAADRRRGFDLARAPLFRLALLRFAGDRHRLVWTVHHLLLDGWSLPRVLGEVLRAYRDLAAGRRPTLPPPGPAFADYVAWLARRDRAAAESFWRTELAGFAEPTPLPGAGPPPPAGGAARPAERSLALPPAVSAALEEAARRRHLTLGSVVAGAWAALLARWGGGEEVLFGLAVSGRGGDLPGIESMVGLLINTVPLRLVVPPRAEAAAWLAGVQARQLALVRFEHTALADVQGWSEVPRGTPLFESLLVFENYPRDALAAGLDGALRLGETRFAERTHYPLTLTAAPGEALHLRLAFEEPRIAPAIAVRLLEHLARLLRGLGMILASGDKTPLAYLPLLSEAERWQLLGEWNDTGEADDAASAPPSAPARIAARLAREPEAVAVACAGAHLSCGELDRRSQALAARLAAEGVGSEAPVAVAVERSPEMVVALLGVWRAGGAYLPLDPRYPPERLAHMLADSGAAVVVAGPGLADVLDAGDVPVVWVGENGCRPHSSSFAVTRGGVGARLAYVLYTSGSTGLPKGVEVDHGALANFLAAMAVRPGLSRQDALLAVTTLSFDIAGLEIWLPLAVGARLEIALREIAADGPSLARALVETAATHLQATPATWRLLLEAGWRASGRFAALCGGEALPRELAERLHAAAGAVWNLYGPTETTIWSAVAAVEEEPGAPVTPAPVISAGRPIARTRIHLLSPELEPVPVGAAGELWIGGVGLARGYHGRPDLTADGFRPDLFAGSVAASRDLAAPGVRLYRTGDLARRRPDGSLEILGRIDLQLKVRGFRVEPGEVEAALAAHADVREVAVVPAPDPAGSGVRLAAFVAPRVADLDLAALRRFAASRLPDHLVPATWVVLPGLPLTPAGKVDRRALSTQAAERPGGAAHAGPAGEISASHRGSPVEELLAGLWAEALALDADLLGPGSSFLELGGHSLIALRLAGRVRATFGVELPPSRFFERPALADLAAEIEALRRGARPAEPPLSPAPSAEPAPLSFAQERLWFLERLAPGGAAYHVTAAFALTGDLAESALAAAWSEIVQRHAPLRTVFRMAGDGSVQQAAPLAAPMMPVLDLTGLPATLRAIEVVRLRERLLTLPFVLTDGPPARLALLRIATGEHHLLAAVHHLVFDGGSAAILWRELAVAYRAFRDGATPLLPPLPLEYADFATWQRRSVPVAAIEDEVAWWRERLAGAPTGLDLPADRAAAGGPGPRGLSAPLAILPAVAAGMAALGRRCRATPFMTLLAAALVWLAWHTGQEDLVLGAPVSGRDRAELEPLIGLFVNVLALRADLAGDPPVRELLARVREAALGAYAHARLPFERLVEALAPEGRRGRSPLVQALLTLDELPVPPDLPGLAAAPLPARTGEVPFDLTFAFARGAGRLSGSLEARRELFDGVTVQRFAARLEVLLAGLAADPEGERRLSQLALLPESERHQLAAEWGGGGSLPEAIPVPAALAAVAARRPDAVALVKPRSEDEERLTFGEMERRAERLAVRLRRLGVERGEIVGLLLPRTPHLAVALLATWKAGAVALPLEPAHPDERLAALLAAAGAFAVITVPALAARVPGSARRLVLGATGEEEALPPAPVPQPRDLAYVLFTSGSTGRPKGVKVEHGSLAAMLAASASRLAWRQDDVAPCLVPVSFDVFFFELLSPLLAGGTAMLLDLGPAPDLTALLAALRPATRLFAVPSLLRPLAARARDEAAAGRPLALRAVVSGGEAVPPDLLAELPRAFPGAEPWVLYGPTEATILATLGRGAELEVSERAPIGRPLLGVELRLAGRGGLPAPIGVPGEVWLGGAGLARGYLDEALTTAAFPAADLGGGMLRWYRTGDLARHRHGGELEFLGRLDDQVKVRGVRVEPGEVEAALAAHPGVAACAVAAVEDGAGDRRLIAYLVPRGETPAAAELRLHLAARLPAAYLPAELIAVDALPLTPHGKLDRGALARRAVAAMPREGTAGRGRPPTAHEALIAALWEGLLGRGGFAPDDDFFAVGGHSLAAVRLAARISTACGVELPVAVLFARPTLAGMAAEVAARLAGGDAASPIPRLPRDGALPVSFAQGRLWFLDQLEPESPLYNIPLAVRLAGPLAPPALQSALAGVAERHEALRTSFQAAGGQPVQTVARTVALPLPLVDLGALTPGTCEVELRRLAEEEARRLFDLTRAPLARAILVRLGVDEHALLLTLHHIVADGWSMGVLLRDVAALHEAALGDGTQVLPELPVQLADFAAWQRRRLTPERLAAEMAHWRRELAGLAPLALPADRPRSAATTSRGAVRRRRLSTSLAGGLAALARAEGSTCFLVQLAVFAAMLGRIGETTDLAIASPAAGRDRPEVQDLIGCFVETLALRIDLAGDPPFTALLARLRQVLLAALAHSELPFEQVIEAVAPERRAGHTPLIAAAFTLHEALPPPRLPGLSQALLEVDPGTAKFDLTLALAEAGESLDAAWEFRRDLFDGATVLRLAGWWESLLAGLAEAGPAARLAELSLLSPPERHQVTREWAREPTDYPRERTVDDLVAERAAATPDAVALDFGEEQISYGELLRRADNLARALAGAARARLEPEARIALLLPRSPELVVASLAVLRAGGAYVPLDPSHPRQRLAQLLAEIAPAALLARRSQAQVLTAALAGFGQWERTELASGAGLADSLLVGRPTADSGPLRRERHLDPVEAGSWPPVEDRGARRPDSLAYVLFTSGSTGVPKGVAVPHRAVVRLVRESDYVRLDAADRVGHLSNPAFDAATFEIWGALAAGARLVGIEREAALEPWRLAARLAERGVTALFLTTALFHQVAREAPDAFAGLDHLLFGGEAIDPERVRAVLAAGPPGRLLHVYGPTESTTFATWHRVVEVPESAVTVPIGRPLANTSLYLLGADGEPVPIGLAGDIALGGDGLARGYAGRPDLTAERFRPAPDGSGAARQELGAAPGARLYLSGDRARWLPGGAVEFLGRRDAQVKIRGFRIEPAEVEAALRRHPQVAEAAVLVDERKGERRLIACVAPRPGPPPAAEELRRFLAGQLPDYMLPAAILLLAELPLNASGKLDRRALAERLPELTAAAAAGEGRVAPRGPTEELLAGLWAELLGLPAAGTEDDFFARGGHSLLATRAVARVRELFGVELPLRDLFEAPTPAALAQRVEAARRAGSPPAPPLRPLPRPPAARFELPASYAQRRLWFLDRLAPGNPFYNIASGVRLLGRLAPPALEAALATVVARHEALRTTFRDDGGRPVQVVARAVRTELPGIDLAALPAAIAASELERLARAGALRPFDLAVGPLLRATLVRLGPAEHALLLDVHHIVADGWSMALLRREVAALYAAALAGTASPLPPLPFQYADFAAWQRETLEARDGGMGARQLAFWRQRLADLPEEIELPFDRPRPAVESFRGGLLDLALDAGLARGLAATARRAGATPAMALLAGFQALLGRLSGRSDVPVGVAVANRTRRELEGLVGFFVNTLVVRTDLAAAGFAGLLARVREASLAAYENQDLPFDRLVEELRPGRDAGRNPLVQVIFALHNFPRGGSAMPGLAFAPLGGEPGATGTAKFDLTLYLYEEEEDAPGDAQGRLLGNVEYNRDLFDGATARRLAGQLATLLAGAAAAPATALADLPLLAEAERHQALAEWSAVEGEYPRGADLWSLFVERVDAAPEAVALAWDGGALSYAALARSAAGIARQLARRGIGPEDRVGLCAERSPELVAGILGIVAAGAAYVPLDPSYPPERLAWMAADAGLAVCLATPSGAGALPAGEALPLTLGGDGSHPQEQARAEPGHGSGERLLYAMYTSGSTGRPKGVAVPHRAVARLVLGEGVARFGPGETLLLFAPASFDASTLEVWGALLTGARLAVAPPGALSLAELGGAIARQGVTLLWLTAGLFHRFADAGLADLAGVRQLLAGGEALSTPRVRRALAELPETRLINGYGPTENTTFTCCGPVLEPPRGTVPLGRPIAGTTIRVLDAGGRPVPVGVPGELCTGGDGLARGYLGQPGLTAERFVPGGGGARLYRTGDLVRWLADGRLELLGRLDGQLKVRGFRIEPEEIEAQLAGHPAVAGCAVAAWEPIPGDLRLAAYVVPAAAADGSEGGAQVAQWEELFDDLYERDDLDGGECRERGEAADADPTFNTVGWVSSYTGEPLPAGEMREWLADTVDRLLALHPRRVLEIGCGTGMLLFRLAPGCELYCGTDLSQRALDYVATEIERRPGGMPQVRLLHRPADRFHDLAAGLAEGGFDLVILNSVVQYFPDAAYLAKVLEGAVQALAPGGAVFLGDLRSLSLLPAFYASVELATSPGDLLLARLRSRVAAAARQEEELALDPSFFAALRRRLPAISRVEVHPKRGRARNELTAFRYQVVLRTGAGDDGCPAPEAPTIDGRREPPSLEVLAGRLARERPARLLLTGLPNARVAAAAEAVRLLSGAPEEGPPSAVAMVEIAARAEIAARGALDPQALCDLAEALGYAVELGWSAPGAEGRFEAALVRRDVGGPSPTVLLPEPAVREEDPAEADVPARWANRPLAARAMRRLVPWLRSWLGERLPAHMVPSAWVVLEELPLNPAGKVDRRRLPLPEESRLGAAAPEAPRTPIEERLASIWAEVLGLGRVGPGEDFFELGGHSLLAVQVISRVRAELAVEIPLRALFEHPTVAGLAAEVETRLGTAGEPGEPPLVPLPLAARSGPLPLSFAQERLWLLDRLEPGSAAYNMPLAVRLAGDLDVAALARALAEIVRRHEPLRTTFPEGADGPVQAVAPAMPAALVSLPVADLSGLPEERRGHEARRVAAAEAQRPFDLARGPLFRPLLLQLAAREHRLIATQHHIASDGWSMGIFAREMAALYAAFRGGLPSPLPEPTIAYADWASWQRRLLAGPAGARQREYWRARLAGAPELLELPTEGPRPAVQGHRGGLRARRLPAELSAGVRRLAVSAGATPFLAVLAAWKGLLCRVTGQLDLVVGVPVAGRTRREVEGLIGFFLNTLALRTDLAGDPGFGELLGRVRETALGAFAHADLPFERLIEELQPARDLARSPLFQVMVNGIDFEAAGAGALRVPGLEMEVVTGAEPAAKFDLEVYAREELGRIVLEVVWDRDLFGAVEVERWLEEVEAVTAAGVAEPGRPLSEIVLVAPGVDSEVVVGAATERLSPRAFGRGAPPRDRREPGELWTVSSRLRFASRRIGGGLQEGLPALAHSSLGRSPSPKRSPRPMDLSSAHTAEMSLGEVFEWVVAQGPERVAISGDAECWTYGALAAMAKRVAHALGVGEEQVGLLFSHGGEMAAAMFGVLAAGKTYVPLDPAHPSLRLAEMVADAGVERILVDRSLVGVARALVGEAAVCLQDLGGAPAEWAPPVVFGEALAYILYTSGSTGRPKGVVQTQGNALAHVSLYAQRLGIGPDDRLTLLPSYTFDAAVMDVFGGLLSGAELVVRDVRREGVEELASWLAEREVTVYHSTPTLLRAWLGGLDEGVELPALRVVVLGGEEVRRNDLARLRSLVRPGCPVVNGLGPTESTLALQWLGDGEGGSVRPSVPVGFPVDGVEASLVTPAGEQPALWGVGEVVLRSWWLATGYWRRGDLTAASFVPDPRRFGGRAYRTGDLGRWLPDGAIEYVGRRDQQVKVRGVRVELGEVEAAVVSLPGVREAAVVAWQGGDGDQRLAAFVVPVLLPERSDLPVSSAASSVAGPDAAIHLQLAGAEGEPWRAALAARLPDALVPARFFLLPALPLTATGKVDRRALSAAAAAAAPAPSSADAEAPRGWIEEALAAVWAEVLDRSEVFRHDDFFALGGHSLAATRVAARLRRDLGVDLPLRRFFEDPTLAALAAVVEKNLAGRGEGQAHPEPPLSPRPERTGPSPLSFSQERLWFLDRLEGGSAAYNIPLPLALTGRLDRRALAAALAEIVARHEILRTTFPADAEGRPVQLVHPPLSLSPPLVDLAALPRERREAEAAALAAAEAGRPFDLARGPLLRSLLLRLEMGPPTGRWVALLTLHHIASDGWSTGVLVRELSALYPALAAGQPSPLPPLPVQYGDFALWQRERLSPAALAAELRFWRERLAGASPLLELPSDRPRPPVASGRGGLRPARLAGDAISSLARRAGATPFMALLAAWAALLGRWSDAEDLTIGTPVAGRARPELEGLIGFFANTLALRADLAGDPPMAALVTRLRETALTSFAHGDLPFERLVEELAPVRSLAHTPIFQVMLALQNAPWSALALPGLELALFPVESRTSRFDLTLTLAASGEEYAGALEYSSDLFDGATAGRLLSHLSTLLTGAAADPERPLSALPLLAEAERHQLAVELMEPRAPVEEPVHRLIAHWTRATPDAVALADGSRIFTFGELARRAGRLAGRLAQRLPSASGGAEQPIGVSLERGWEMATALLAVLDVGAAYLPLDPTYPSERLAWMLADAAPAVVIAGDGTMPPAIGVPVLSLSDLSIGSASGSEAPGRAPLSPAAFLAPLAGPDALAYLIYTSGSTGRPKGIALPHRTLSNLVAWQLDSSGRPLRTLQFASPSFDVSVQEVLGTWAAGAALVPVAEAMRRDPGALWRLVREMEIERLFLPPVVLQALAEAAAAEEGGRAPALREIIVAGEQLRITSELVRFFAGHPDCALRNQYGPSETHVATEHALAAGFDPSLWPTLPPVGRPIAALSAQVLTSSLAPSPIGVPGELYLGGAGLARGYLGRPDSTAERFVPDPWPDSAGGGRLYRTGDLARVLPSGAIEFLGRLDRQVKVRGFRIEPAEVEAALEEHPAVRAAAVVAQGEGAARRLIAFVLPADQAASAPDLARTLAGHLRERLPAWMVPAAFVPLATFPLTASGKVGRRALERLAVSPAEKDEAPAVHGEDPVAGLLAGIFAEVLGRDAVGAGEDFFALGGHSLLAARVAARVRAAFEVDLPLRALFESPTPAGLAPIVLALRGEAAPSPPPLVSRPRAAGEGDPPLSFAQERLWFLDRLAPGGSAYNLPLALAIEGPPAGPTAEAIAGSSAASLPGSLDPAALAAALAALAARHESLRTCLPPTDRGPVQRRLPPLPLGALAPLPLLDLAGLDDLSMARAEQAARELAAAEAARPFDLARGPLWRATLLRLAPRRHVLLLTLHHAVADGWSLDFPAHWDPKLRIPRGQVVAAASIVSPKY